MILARKVLISDARLTELAPGTVTALFIDPEDNQFVTMPSASDANK